MQYVYLGFAITGPRWVRKVVVESQARGWRSLMRSGEKTTDRLEVGCYTVGDRIYRRGRHEDSYIRVPGEIAEPLGDTIRNEF